MPVRWRTNFIDSGLNFASSSLETLCTYMVQQELQTDVHRKKNHESNKKGNGNGQKQKSAYPLLTNSAHSGKSKRTAGQQGSKDNKRKKLGNDDDCPIHCGSHKWGQCHQNQYGNSFRPLRQTTSTTGTFMKIFKFNLVEINVSNVSFFIFF